MASPLYQEFGEAVRRAERLLAPWGVQFGDVTADMRAGGSSCWTTGRMARLEVDIGLEEDLIALAVRAAADSSCAIELSGLLALNCPEVSFTPGSISGPNAVRISDEVGRQVETLIRHFSQLLDGDLGYLPSADDREDCWMIISYHTLDEGTPEWIARMGVAIIHARRSGDHERVVLLCDRLFFTRVRRTREQKRACRYAKRFSRRLIRYFDITLLPPGYGQRHPPRWPTGTGLRARIDRWLAGPTMEELAISGKKAPEYPGFLEGVERAKGLLAPFHPTTSEVNSSFHAGRPVYSVTFRMGSVGLFLSLEDGEIGSALEVGRGRSRRSVALQFILNRRAPEARVPRVAVTSEDDSIPDQMCKHAELVIRHCRPLLDGDLSFLPTPQELGERECRFLKRYHQTEAGDS